MGTITLNDEKLEGRLLKAAYDAVEETLMFSQVPTVAIAIRLEDLEEGWNSRSLSASKKKSQVQALIDQLDFRSITNTK